MLRLLLIICCLFHTCLAYFVRDAILLANYYSYYQNYKKIENVLQAEREFKIENSEKVSFSSFCKSCLKNVEFDILLYPGYSQKNFCASCGKKLGLQVNTEVIYEWFNREEEEENKYFRRGSINR